MQFPPWATDDHGRHLYLLKLAALHSSPGGSIYALSNRLGRGRKYIYNLERTGGRVTPEDALALAEITNGVVSKNALRPDIWPEG